ncbi:hypothetical protein AALP_AA2G009000 [Arabis alpina]|uniref:Cystatin domain-containing protein n=1 Tax=Arabis alpina TaxID=50452 RepID=A0A087HEI8_ARAAL|nr:hypothetical protein AALP_AA2G009000 [Arabis alpina]
MEDEDAAFKGWREWLEPAYLLRKYNEKRYQRPPYMTRAVDDDEFTPEEECAMIDEQVNKSDGFDIDFSLFRCVFNYHSAILDSHQFVDEPETTEDLLNRLSRGSLDKHNKDNGTKFEFVKVVRANYHFSGAITYLITFQVKDPYDGLIKNFQARVRYSKIVMPEYILCRPEPDQAVECVGISKTDIEKVAKRQRLEKDVEKQG